MRIQNSTKDYLILEYIKTGKIVIDAKNGFVYKKIELKSKRSIHDKNDNLQKVGYLGYDGKHLLFRATENDNRYSCYVCRAIYLSVHGHIPQNYEVFHKNNDCFDNRIENLDIRIFTNPWKSISGFWDEKDIEELMRLAPTMSEAKLALHFKRSKHAIKLQLKKRGFDKGINKAIRWTKEEDEKLKKLYLTYKYTLEQITEMMFPKKIGSVKKRIKKFYGKKKKMHPLKLEINKNNFCGSIKSRKENKNLKIKCCICGYDKWCDLHHIDGNNKNNHVSNISSLCPNHHREVEMGEHKNVLLYCIWWRIFKDGTILPEENNLKEVQERFTNGIN